MRPLLTPLFVLLFLPLLARPTSARPTPASDITGTLLSWNSNALQIQASDGRARIIPTTAATWTLRRGLPSDRREFVVGDALQIRLGRGLGGSQRALLVCDPETAAALAAQRGHPLVGTLLKTGGKVWIVQPTDASLPLPVCLSTHTHFEAGQAAVTAASFSEGASVTILARGLPNGLLSAVSVTDGSEAATAQAAPKARKTFSGTLLEARPDLGLLTLQDKNGLTLTIAIDAQTVIKVHIKKMPRIGTWADLITGRRVTAHFGGNSDAAGNPVASNLSVTVLP